MVLFYIISAVLSTIIYHFLLFILIFAIFIHFIVVWLPHRARVFFHSALSAQNSNRGNTVLQTERSTAYGSDQSVLRMQCFLILRYADLCIVSDRFFYERLIRNSFKIFLRSPAPDPRTGSDRTDDTYRGQR